MTPITRRTFLAGAGAAATTLAAGPYVHALKRGGTLRIVPHADLKVLDPIWTTGYITRNHGYMIFDTLFAMRPLWVLISRQQWTSFFLLSLPHHAPQFLSTSQNPSEWRRCIKSISDWRGGPSCP